MPEKLLVTFLATSGNLLRQAVEFIFNDFYKANNPASR